MRQLAAAPAQASLGGAHRLERHSAPQAHPVHSDTAPALDLSAVPVRNPVQFKSAAGASDDALEREADSAAEHVTRMPEPANKNVAVARREASQGAVSALNSPGQKLDAATRAFMEPRFGRDFGHVRVHTDAPAAASAHAAGALAYTSGVHIAFAARQYDPVSTGGRALIAHELAHVVQQQNTGMPRLQRKQPGPTAPAPAPPQPAPAQPAAAQHNPEIYGRTPVPLSPPSRSFTLALAKQFIAQRIGEKPPGLTSASIKGATPGPNTEIFLWYILASVARREMWGSENDLIEPIDWPSMPLAPLKNPDAPPPGMPIGPTPMAAVTVRIDDKGVGEIELVSTKPVEAAKTFTDPGVAKTSLAATFGLAAVSDTPRAQWTADQLNIVSDAFALLPAVDKAALKGVELIRVATIDDKHSAQFSRHLDSLAAGSTTPAGTPSTLEISDSAFDADKKMFVGGPTALPRSTQTIVHEVGHAIESQAVADAHDTAIGAGVAHHKAYDALKDANDKRNNIILGNKQPFDAPTRAKYDDATKLRDSRSGAERATRATLTKAQASETATMVPAADAAAGLTAMKSAGTAAEAALKAAQTAAGTFNQKDASDSAAYRKSIDDLAKLTADTAKQIETAPDAVAALAVDTAVDKAVETRNNEKKALQAAAAANPALAQFAAAEASLASWTTAVQTQVRLPHRTVRLQNFVNFVNANKITPFTPYAKENWPHNPGEFYAEAYSLWRTDPEYLKTNANALFTWFEAGHYRD